MISCYITSQVLARTKSDDLVAAPQLFPPRLVSKSTPSASGMAYPGVPPRSPHDTQERYTALLRLSASTHSRYFIISGFSLQCLDVERSMGVSPIKSVAIIGAGAAGNSH
jgi:hypothetical protein